jgi:hypothetical protein
LWLISHTAATQICTYISYLSEKKAQLTFKKMLKARNYDTLSSWLLFEKKKTRIKALKKGLSQLNQAIWSPYFTGTYSVGVVI